MIKALITDFDGTLVDSFEANFCAYREAFMYVGLTLNKEDYLSCFGFRFDRFMEVMQIRNKDTAKAIRDYKSEVYSNYFDRLKLNENLFSLISSFHHFGGKTAISSTARKENLLNAAKFLKIEDAFDQIFAGIDVQNGKPSPEIYIKTMNSLGVSPEETLIFEDTNIGFKAAKNAGARLIRVDNNWFDDDE